jgi:hypothetical protein
MHSSLVSPTSRINLNGKRYMKAKKLVAALAFAITTSSIHSTALATEPSASGIGAASVQSTVMGNFSVGTNGTATSYARNSQAATASVFASAGHTPRFNNVDAGINGATTTSSFGMAYNVSTGSGLGSALSSGAADTSVAGVASIHGVATGFNGGYAGTQTGNIIFAGTSSGSYVAGQTLSGFDTQLFYSRSATAAAAPAGTAGGTRSSTVGLSTQTTGYASGANATGALEGMNAAGISNIGSSGMFFAKAGLSAAVSASAP